jgi:hypothetical protein
MNMQVKTINDIGFEMIRKWVIETSQEDDSGPYQPASDRAIEYWCREAEEGLGAGNPALIEMSASDTRSGRTETFIVPDSGISTNIIED